MKATANAWERMHAQVVETDDACAGSRRTLTAVWVVLLLMTGPAWANITGITGNVHGNPVKAYDPPRPCPWHASHYCWSQLVPTDVTLIPSPTDWFKTTLQSEYSGAEWNFYYTGGNTNMNGTFDVVYYRAYNDCPGLMGAQIEASFVPDPAGSIISDVLWIQTYRELWPGHDVSAVDDMNAGTKPGALPGPFYPYQDEDENPPRWQSGYQYDYFYDKPGDLCPVPRTVKSLHFETYAIWWDDYFNADGSITDVRGDGHHVYIHEGFTWGYELHCVPVPAPTSLALVMLGLGALGHGRRRRR